MFRLPYGMGTGNLREEWYMDAPITDRRMELNADQDLGEAEAMLRRPKG